jgi:hypothetical protein
MKKGWILLHRKIYSSNDFRNELDRSIFIFLLCQASYEPTQVVYRKKKITLQRGELLITYSDIAKKFGMTIQNVRTVMKNLKLTGTLTVTLTRGLMRISIEKYIKYQDIEIKSTGKLTGTLTNRRKNINKLNNNIYIGKNTMNKKIDIKSSKVPLKDLKQTIYENESVSEFEIARQRLSKDRFEDFVKFKLAESNKSN